MSSSAASTSNVELAVSGMHCGSCVALIEETLADQAGVEHVSVTLEPPRASVSFDAEQIGLDELCATVSALGYTASPATESSGSA